MKLINGKVYIEWDEAVKAGITVSTLHYYRHKSPNTKIYFIKDAEDRRRVLIEFETMHPEYKQRIVTMLGDPSALVHYQYIKQFLKTDEKAISFYHNFRLPNGKGLPVDYIHSLITQVQWLNILANSKRISAQLKLTNSGLHESVLKIIEIEDIGLPRTYQTLKRKLKKYLNLGYLSLIDVWRFGNCNSKKMSDEQEQHLIALMSDPHKPPVEHVYHLMLQHCAQRKWAIVSLETVRSFLMRPDIQAKWFAGRHNEDVYRNKYEYVITREKASGTNALWVIDGTDINLSHSGETGRKIESSLYIVWVADAHSRMIIGSQVSLTEDTETVYQAFNNACRRTLSVPSQISYDNSKANTSNSMQALLNNKAFKYHFPTQPYNGKSKIIENITRWIQDSVMRYDDAFRGMNITTSRLDSRPNTDFIAALAKQKKIPGIKETIKKIYHYISLYNRYGTKAYLYMATDDGEGYSKESPLATYKTAMQMGRTISEMELVNVFWMSKQNITYKNYGIRIEFDKQKYEYEVKDADGLYCRQFMSNNIGSQFEVKFDPNDMSYVYLYQNGQYIAVAEPKNRLPEAIADYKEGDGHRIQNIIRKRKQETTFEIDEAVTRRHVMNVNLGYKMIDKIPLAESEAEASLEYVNRKIAQQNMLTNRLQDSIAGFDSLYTIKGSLKPLDNEE